MEDQLRDLLEKTIAYQDVIDDNTNTTKLNRSEMMVEWYTASRLFPEVMDKYNFGPISNDRQLEFDNLQKFINDFHRIK
jgi:hypothetical protein